MIVDWNVDNWSLVMVFLTFQSIVGLSLLVTLITSIMDKCLGLVIIHVFNTTLHWNVGVPMTSVCFTLIAYGIGYMYKKDNDLNDSVDI